MTPDQRDSEARKYSPRGQSEREVAAELEIGAATAHRLRKRLETGDGPAPEITELRPDDRQDGITVNWTAERPPWTFTDEAIAISGEEAELVTLAALREQLAEQLVTFMERAEASRQAVADLEAQRLELLDAGADAAPLRSRVGSAHMDQLDSETAAQRCRARLEATEARIAELNGLRELAGLRAQLDAAVAERDEVYARTGDRQRAAVTAVRAAAEEFCAVVADERAAAGRVAALSTAVAQRALQLGEQVPVVPPAASTRIVAQGGLGGELAVTRALFQAGRGDVAAVARFLGEANGWLPPGPPSAEEMERFRRMTADRERQLAEAKAQNASGPRAPEHPVPVGVDDRGNPVDIFGNVLRIRGARIPHPLDSYGLGYGNGGGYGTGYRTGY